MKTSLLAAAFVSGTVAAWNTVSKASNTPIVEFANVHQSPATCLALSPITDSVRRSRLSAGMFHHISMIVQIKVSHSSHPALIPYPLVTNINRKRTMFFFF